MPDLPPSPAHRARWKRARHWKARMVLLRHLVNLATMLAVAACIAVIYRMVGAYAAREGYTRADVGRVGSALFLAGGLLGALACYCWMAGRRR